MNMLNNAYNNYCLLSTALGLFFLCCTTQLGQLPILCHNGHYISSKFVITLIKHIGKYKIYKTLTLLFSVMIAKVRASVFSLRDQP